MLIKENIDRRRVFFDRHAMERIMFLNFFLDGAENVCYNGLAAELRYFVNPQLGCELEDGS